MHFRRVLFTTLVWVSLMGCLQQGGPTGTSPSGTSGNLGGGLLNPGGTTGNTNPEGSPVAATQDVALPDATQSTPPDRPPSTAVPEPIHNPPRINVGQPQASEQGEESGEDGDSERQTLGEQIAEQQRQEMQERQEEHEEFENQMREALQGHGLGMQEPASEEEAAFFPIVSAPAPLVPAGGQILQREPLPYPNLAPSGSNTPVRNLGNGQQQFPAMRQPLPFSNNPSIPLQP